MKRALATTASAAVLLGWAGTAPAQADGGDTDGVERIAERIERVAPEAGQDLLGARTEAGRGLAARGDGLNIDLPDHSRGTLTLARPGTGGAKLALGMPQEAEQRPAQVADDGTVAYPDALPHTDLAVQPMERSARVQTVLKSAGAPEEFTFPVDVPDGGRLAPGKDGSVAVLDARGKPVGGIEAPWAKDADGKAVPTEYRVEGDRLIQTVRHRGAAYPVVADPWMGQDLIQDAKLVWVHAVQKFTLQITPTNFMRAQQSDYFIAQAAWEELLAKYQQPLGIHRNHGGLWDQFLCHHQFAAFAGNTWNIEDWRPDISYPGTILAQCNPE
ncbi:DUF2599 domain-containing protein [Streptomyces sp. A7024]|uniref:DUF2599 domain-containing protein n=1 Tax=Streptomyces coryli TaxID=1128680 RepID=A0A6G4TUS4_9ACTN|nr:DUF2599 domain-containing protein [Streptomyces coryli]NGN63634.1 DUF2599 domain-containing protein [Streptomyces coryli]